MLKSRMAFTNGLGLPSTIAHPRHMSIFLKDFFKAQCFSGQALGLNWIHQGRAKDAD